MDNWIIIPPLKGPEGVQTAAYAPWGFNVGRCIVANKSAHPDVAFRVCDLMYNNQDPEGCGSSPGWRDTFSVHF